MVDGAGGDRRHLELISAARMQFERAVTAGMPSGSSVNAHSLTRPAERNNKPTIPGYLIERELHRGGQGIVFLATRESTGRQVAVKVLREGPFAGEAERIRFEREVNILAGLQHRNIIGIMDRGEAAGSHFLVMDYINGRPLDRFARERNLSTRERLLLFAEVCEAVSDAHLRGVIHRDLKPGNILVTDSGEPRILDFGLAKQAGTPSMEATATQTGQILGSLPWISPEQVRGHHEAVDIRSDVYSLGVILYQLLTDRFPYSTVGDLEQVLTSIRSAQPVRPSTLSDELDDDLDTITLKCLAKEPERRYQSVGELVRDIRYYLAGEAIEAKRDSTWYLAKIMLRRHRAAVAVAAGFVAVMTISSVALTVLYQGKTAEQKRAQAEASKATQIAQFAQGMLSGIDPATAGDMDKRLVRMILDESARRVESELNAQPDVQAAIHQTIGQSYQAIGALSEARSHLEKALETRRGVVGAEHADTLASMDSVAMLDLAQGELARAEQVCKSALDASTRVLGPDHPQTLLTTSNLSEIMQAQGKFADAEILNRDVLERRKRILGMDHPDTLTSMNNLAGVLRIVEKFDEAEVVYLSTIDVEKRVKGELHPQTLCTANNLALLYFSSGRLDQAEPGYRNVLALRQRVLGDDHPDTLNSLGNLAELLRAKGQLDEAEATFRRLIDTERRVLGEWHPTLGIHLLTLASIVGQRGDLQQAEKLLRDAVAINTKSLPPDHWQIASSKLGLGACLVKLGKYVESEQLLLDGQAAIQGKPEVPDAWKNAAVNYLVKLYDAWEAAEPGTGKTEKATQWRATLTATSAKAN